MSCVWVQGVDLKDLIKKFALSSFCKGIKLQLISQTNVLELFFQFVFSSLHCIAWAFALCFWLAQNYRKICFRDISFAKLKWKECTRSIINDGFLYYGWPKLHFILNFPWFIFLVGFFFFFFFFFFANYCHLLSFLKNHKIEMSPSFAL